MKRYTGKTIAEGTALGKLMFYAGGREALRPRTVSDAEQELARYQEGEAAAAAQLRELSRGHGKRPGKRRRFLKRRPCCWRIRPSGPMPGS